MNPRTLILAFVALSLAGGTALFARHWLDSQRAVVAAAPPKQAPAKEVLVAAKPLATGSFVKPDALKWQPWPEDGIAATYAVKGRVALSAFVGGVVRQDIAAGEPVTDARVVKPGDRGFLAAVLTPGMRAVSAPINAETGISGLVFPGDRVDLLLTQGFRASNKTGAPMRRASETVLSDIRVLAIDQRTADREAKPAVGKTVTLEVTPKQAEEVSVAEQMGKLSLSLRSLATEGVAVAQHNPGPTWDTQVSAVIGRSFGGGSGAEVQVVHGGKAESVSVKGGGTAASRRAPAHVAGPMADMTGGLGGGLITVARGSASAAAVATKVLP